MFFDRSFNPSIISLVLFTGHIFLLSEPDFNKSYHPFFSNRLPGPKARTPKPQNRPEPMGWIPMCEGHVWIGRKTAEGSQQIHRTKCFCLHLWYLNATMLPNVNQGDRMKDGQWWQTKIKSMGKLINNNVVFFFYKNTDFFISWTMHNLNLQQPDSRKTRQKKRGTKQLLCAEMLHEYKGAGL